MFEFFAVVLFTLCSFVRRFSIGRCVCVYLLFSLHVLFSFQFFRFSFFSLSLSLILFQSRWICSIYFFLLFLPITCWSYLIVCVFILIIHCFVRTHTHTHALFIVQYSSSAGQASSYTYLLCCWQHHSIQCTKKQRGATNLNKKTHSIFFPYH